MIVLAERGVVLISALLLLVLLASATGATLWLVRADLRAVGVRRAAVQARYTAEAALQAAAASLPPSTRSIAEEESFAGLPLGDFTTFPGPPFGYTLRRAVGASGDGGIPLLRVEVDALAVGAAQRSLRGTIVRRSEPWAPAALLVSEGTVTLEGAALSIVDPPNILFRGDQHRPALAAGNPATERRLFALLHDSRVATWPRRPVAFARPIEIGVFAAASGLELERGPEFSRGDRLPAARLLGGGRLASLDGRGLVISLGDLQLDDGANFDGVLLVSGRLSFSGTPCQVRGFVQAFDVRFENPCAIDFDAGAVREADALVPLPRGARLHAIEEIS